MKTLTSNIAVLIILALALAVLSEIARSGEVSGVPIPDFHSAKTSSFQPSIIPDPSTHSFGIPESGIPFKNSAKPQSAFPKLSRFTMTAFYKEFAR
jgi:hypothetical protein